MDSFVGLIEICFVVGLILCSLVVVLQRARAKRPRVPPITRGHALGPWYYGGAAQPIEDTRYYQRPPIVQRPPDHTK